MIIPDKLKRGDKVATISISFGTAAVFPHRYQAGVAELKRKFEVDVVEMPNSLKTHTWLQNNPQERAKDFMQAVEDKSIKAIICNIGGNDSVSILKYLDIEKINQNPKIFLGYSDATAIHVFLYKLGITSYYGPTIMAGFAENGGMQPYSYECLKKMICDEKCEALYPSTDGWTNEFLDWSNPENQSIKRKLHKSCPPKLLQGTGKVTGHLIGGCLESLELLKETDYFFRKSDFDDAILFLELSDINLGCNYFMKCLRNYGLMGCFDKIKALIIGRPGEFFDDITRLDAFDEMTVRVVAKEFGHPEIPIISRMDFGHTEPMMTLPYGVKTTLDTKDLSLKF
jgi:muramoyltetrapeptide carboxypeptidase LdcA involved in peptidoglycan recycling